MTNWKAGRRQVIMALTARLHTCYNGRYKGLLHSDVMLISKKPIVVRIESATRLHEVGIASNRGSECRGEYVPALYTPPVTPWEFVAPEVASLTAKRAVTTVADDWGEVVTR